MSVRQDVAMTRSRPDYQLPPPPELVAAAWERKHLRALDLFRIGAWKSAKGLGLLSLNSEDEIHTVTGEAMAEIAAWRQAPTLIGCDDDSTWAAWRRTACAAAGSNFIPRKGLMRLRGVGYPMATAILCVLDPDHWPVMDKWAISSVFGHRSFDWKRAVVYQTFARHLATQPAGEAKTLHDLDQLAMRASMKGETLPPGWTTAAVP